MIFWSATVLTYILIATIAVGKHFEFAGETYLKILLVWKALMLLAITWRGAVEILRTRRL